MIIPLGLWHEWNKEPAKSFCQNELNLDETIVSNVDSEEDDYHKLLPSTAN